MRYTSRGDVEAERADDDPIMILLLSDDRVVGLPQWAFDALFQPADVGEIALEDLRRTYSEAEWIVTDGEGDHPFGPMCNGFPGLAVRREHPNLQVPIIIIQAGESDMRTPREQWNDVVALYVEACEGAGVTP